MRPPLGQIPTLPSTPAGDLSTLPGELRRRLIQSKAMKKKRKLDDTSASSLELDRPVTRPLAITPDGTTASDTSILATLTEQVTAIPNKATSDSEEGEISEDEALPSTTSLDMDLDVDVITSPNPNIRRLTELSLNQPLSMPSQRWYEGRDPSEPARPGTLDNSITVADLVESKLHILDLLAQGVRKEDLVDVIKLSPQFVAVVFAELGLRLPTNIKPEDIPPLPTGSPVPRAFDESGIPSEAIRWQHQSNHNEDPAQPVPRQSPNNNPRLPPLMASATTTLDISTSYSAQAAPQNSSSAPLISAPTDGSATVPDISDAGKAMAQLRNVLIERRTQGVRTPVEGSSSSTPSAMKELSSVVHSAPPSGSTAHIDKRRSSSGKPRKVIRSAPTPSTIDQTAESLAPPVVVGEHAGDIKSPRKPHATPWPRSRDSLPPTSPSNHKVRGPSTAASGSSAASPARRATRDSLLQEKLAKLKASQKMREMTNSPALIAEPPKSASIPSSLLPSAPVSPAEAPLDPPGTMTNIPPPLSFTLSPHLIQETIASSMGMPAPVTQPTPPTWQTAALQPPRRAIPLPLRPSEPSTPLSSAYQSSTASSSSAPAFPRVPTRTHTLDSAGYSSSGRATKRLRATDLMDESSPMSFYGTFTDPGNFIPGLFHFSECVIEVSDDEQDEVDNSPEISDDEEEELMEADDDTALPVTQEVGIMADAFLGPLFDELVPKAPSTPGGNVNVAEAPSAVRDHAEEIRKLKLAIAMAEERAAKRAKRETSSPTPGPYEQSRASATSSTSSDPNDDRLISADIEMTDRASTPMLMDEPEDMHGSDTNDAPDVSVVDDYWGQRALSDKSSSSDAFDGAVRTRLNLKKPHTKDRPEAEGSTAPYMSESTPAPPGPSKASSAPMATITQSSDTSVGQQTSTRHWIKYQSPLGSAGPLTSTRTPNSPRDAVSHSQGVVDLAPLRSTALSRHAQEKKALCPFEIPGGGICVDTTCSYAHTRDLQPTDEEVAQFLNAIFASLTIPQVVGELKKRPTGNQDLNARVIHVLDKLGLR
ncbi:hypothetical protein FRB97_005477 [Tulasnella sp. 331]|nr:hypothetical protein FRB97_005477 [Tulasnella sp. 331]